MSDDWIKLRVSLQSHPKVVRILSATTADKFRVIGGLHAVWCVFDAHSEHGKLVGYTPELMDHIIGWPGFSQAMIDVGWLDFDGDRTLYAVDFETHNGKSAKRRAEDQRRKRNSRKALEEVEKTCPQSVRDMSKKSVTRERERERVLPPNPLKGEQGEKRKSAEKWEPLPNLNQAAWSEFEQHRREIRKPLTNQSRTKNANILVRYPPAVQQAMVDRTIANRWAGVFPLDSKQSQQPGQELARPSLRML